MDLLACILPDDVLACILRRLNPRSLAASRCVCKAWCAVVDTRSLLRADLLPLSVYGIFFLEETPLGRLEFFARPLMEHRIADKFDYLDVPCHHNLQILDHRNGLLLLEEWVANPATRQCVPLPPPPPLSAGMEDFYDLRYLVFDPTVSPHYDVFSIPTVPLNQTSFPKETEWPPSPYTINVFSSRTWRWEKRSFVPEGGATRTIADMKFSWKHRYAVCWRAALYVHCQDDSILRLNLLSHKYQVVTAPPGWKVSAYTQLYLGKSTNGVYCALTCNKEDRLRVWLLREVCGRPEWVLKNDVSIQPLVRIKCQDFGHQKYGLWSLQYAEPGGFFANDEATVELKFEWDLDQGITLEAEVEDKKDFFHDNTRILGFHPYKEIVLLWTSRRVVAYHLNSSRAQDLGKLVVSCIETSFVYTPLLDREIIRK